jgi:hypothetical protein
LLLLPIDGNDDDALIATAAATITLFVNSDYNSTLDGNPIPHPNLLCYTILILYT